MNLERALKAKATDWILGVGLGWVLLWTGAFLPSVGGAAEAAVAVPAAAPATPPGAEGGLPPALKRFVAAKEKQVRRVAERVGMETVPATDEFFKAATAGDWMGAMGVFQDVMQAMRGGGDDPDSRALTAVQAAAVLEVQLAFEQIMETEPTLALSLGEAMMASVPKG